MLELFRLVHPETAHLIKAIEMVNTLMRTLDMSKGPKVLHMEKEKTTERKEAGKGLEDLLPPS